ncbi:MAG: hypothetical protein AUK34_11460 [Ignavibacteria bacterium CG2_30_36_16]|nr:MAG: hypothetical protein AUK34_11460 [Ignavibacteria bacterium CG2_30_36_16]PJB01533.1 MAG: hypothetical protein CO127_03305 [Ignavibacteria bacterium CG_4_9_14_3_um_filter_36_18]
MTRKIKYALLDDVDHFIAVIEDGRLATAHFNDKFIVANWYSIKSRRNLMKIILMKQFGNTLMMVAGL